MKFTRIITLAAIVFLINACAPDITGVKSPNENLSFSFLLVNGKPAYTVTHKSIAIIDTSYLGFELSDGISLRDNFRINSTKSNYFKEDWETLWGENKHILNEYDELLVELVQESKDAIKLNIRFRVFNDGIGFRYEFPEQAALNDFIIMDELTEFKLTGNHLCWWIPGDHDSYEYSYSTTKYSEIDVSKTEYSPRWDRFVSNMKAVNTPITMKTVDNLYLSFHEANLKDYADMTLIAGDDYTLKADLVPWADGSKVKAKTPFVSPWRTVTIAESPTELAASTLILNLNDPNQIEDVSWIEPMKYIGIWWEMHIAKSSWGRGKVEGSWAGVDRSIHGATTENAKKYIDFAAAHGIRGLLIEGWNTGWEYWGVDTTEFFDFITPYDDFDIKEVVRYAKEKGVEIIGHHETAGDVVNYDKRVEGAFEFYNELGIKAVKTGYAGQIRPKGERHHGQFMVRHYRKVYETAAKYNIMVDAHEPIKDTGERRTFPNMMTREGVRGMEYNAWSSGNTPEHTTILPFTRGLAGPIDYTPGIFDLTFDKYKKAERVHTTLAKQLALYVVLFSPLNMAADLPENYSGNPALEFIKEVPVTWDDTKVLDASIGDYVVTARRSGKNWFVGGITDENPRDIECKLNFLESGKKYSAEIFADGDDNDYDLNPGSLKIVTQEVDSETVLSLKLAKSGGAAIILKLSE